MKNIRFWTLIAVLGLSWIGVKALPVLADCPEGTTGDDVIDCNTPPIGNNTATGDIGNDVITVEAGLTIDAIAGDATGSLRNGMGQAGDDTLTNNGTVGMIMGDFSDGPQGGNDTITNNGTSNGNIYGDFVALPPGQGNTVGGNDTITNNGTVNAIIYGDYNVMTGGNDTITNNGTINGSIYGDAIAGGTVGGNDNITNAGTVNGDISADEGNDTVTIVVGSTVSGTISGGTGTDTIVFSGSTTDEDGFNQIQSLVNCNPCSGTVTLDGKTYTFDSFEALKNLLILLAKAAGANIDINFAQRVNGSDKGAPFAVYCTADTIKVVDIAADSKGAAEFSFTLGKLPKAGNQPIVLASGEGNQLLLQPDGTLLVVGPSLDGAKTYTFPLTTSCGFIRSGTES